MANTKSGVKNAPSKRSQPAAATTAAKVKPVTKAKAAKPEPAAKTTAAPKAIPGAATAKPAKSHGKKMTGIPLEQRTHYIEVAAYHIAERRGFVPGNPLEDWVQAEAEINRLLAEGRLGG